MAKQLKCEKKGRHTYMERNTTSKGMVVKLLQCIYCNKIHSGEYVTPAIIKENGKD